jgi:hypothetical protein
LGWPAAQKAENRAQADRGLVLSRSSGLRLGAALSPSQLVVGHQIFAACGAIPVLGWRAAQKAEQAASRSGNNTPSFRGRRGADDLVLSRCCIYSLLPAAYCLVHATCNKSARAGVTAAGGRHGTRHRRRRCSAELAAGGGGGGASPPEPQKERRVPGLLSARDRLA